MAKNVQGVLFLRNGSLYGTRDAALTGIRANSDSVADGQFILARYGSGNNVKTLVGVKYSKGENSSLTIFDIEGASADVEKLREEIDAKLGDGITSGNTATAQLAALSGTNADTSATTSVAGAKKYADDLISTLDYTDTAVTGSYVSAVNEADGKIAVTRVALPDASTVSGESKVVIDVTQDKGAITATAANITGVKLAGYAEGTDADIAATDTLGEALGKLQAQINAMDKSADVVNGQVVTTVTEVDGKVTETKANVKDLQLGGYQLDDSTGPIASADTINVALSKLENKVAANHISNDDASITVTEQSNDDTDIMVNIKSGEKVIRKDGNAGIWTDIAISAVTGTELTKLGTNVKEAYKLVDSYGGKLGEYVKIYKDSALVNFFLGHVDDELTDADPTTHESPTSAVTSGTGDTALVYVMQLANGNYKLTAVDVEAFIEEAEFASGVTWDNEAHKVKGVVDPDSELDEANVPFLTVDADGFKISGIKDAINTKINKLDVTGDTAQSGKYITHINETDGKIQIGGRANISEAPLNGYSKGTASGDVTSSDSINDAISKLQNRIAGEIDALDADKSGNTAHVTVGVKEVNGKITAVTVSESDIANASDLAELSGKTITAVTSTNSSISASLSNEAGNKTVDIQTDASKIKMSGFTAAASGFTAITEASSVTQAVKAIETEMIANEQTTAQALTDLDGRLDVIESGYVETVKVNNVALAETNNAVNVQISSSQNAATTTGNEAIVVNTDANGAITLGIAYIDCGEY